MKLVTVILLTLVTTTIVQAQFDWDSRNWNKQSLGFGCSVSGEMSRPVERATQLLLHGKFSDIRKLLYSDLPADQFLGVILAINLSNKKELKLNKEEMKRIDEIKASNEIVPVCAGCTYWDEVPLHDLLSSKTRLGAQNWFHTIYKLYRKKKRRTP